MIRGIGRLTVYSRIILWVQPPVKELPTFPFLGFYSHNVTARHGIKKERKSVPGGDVVEVETKYLLFLPGPLFLYQLLSGALGKGLDFHFRQVLSTIS